MNYELPSILIVHGRRAAIFPVTFILGAVVLLAIMHFVAGLVGRSRTGS